MKKSFYKTQILCIILLILSINQNRIVAQQVRINTQHMTYEQKEAHYKKMFSDLIKKTIKEYIEATGMPWTQTDELQLSRLSMEDALVALEGLFISPDFIFAAIALPTTIMALEQKFEDESSRLMQLVEADTQFIQERQRRIAKAEIEYNRGEQQREAKQETETRSGGEKKSDSGFYRNGQKPIELLILDNYKNGKFYIYSDEVIAYYNTNTNELFECARKQKPIYQNWNGKVWAFSFSLSIGNNQQQTYTVSTNGEVWAKDVNGNFSKYGYITFVDF